MLTVCFEKKTEKKKKNVKISLLNIHDTKTSFGLTNYPMVRDIQNRVPAGAREYFKL